MICLRRLSSRRIFRPRALLVTCLMISIGTSTAMGDDLAQDSSLRWISSETGFYASMLRGGEQWDRVVDSLAVSRLQQLFMVQSGIAFVKSMIEANEDSADQREQLRAVWEMMKESGVVDLANDAWRNEVFFHGDSQWAPWIDWGFQLNSEIQMAQISAPDGDDALDDVEEERLFQIIRQAVTDAGDLEFPRLTIGFRLTDQEPAKLSIAMVEKWLEEVVDQPGISVQQSDQQGDRFVEMVITFADLPWEDWLRDAESSTEEMTIKLVQEALQEKSLHIGLGIQSDYLLICIGPDLKALKSLKGDKLLLAMDEMKNVRDISDRRVTSISYVSHRLAQAGQRPKESIDNAFNQIEQLILGTDWATENQQLAEDVTTEIADLGNDLKAWLPEVSTVVSAEWMRDDGYESFTQNFGENLLLDGSKKLDILKYAGADPMMMSASNSKHNGEGYRLLVKWVRRCDYWFNRMLEEYPEESEELRLRTDVVMPVVRKYFNQFDEITSQILIPSMGTQSLVIVDDKLSSKQWFPAMPESKQPLAIPQFSQVGELKDSEAYAQAIKAYSQWTVALREELEEVFSGEIADLNQRIERARGDEKSDLEELRSSWQVGLDSVASIEFPEVVDEDLASGKLQYIPIAEEFVDEQVAPALMITDQVAIFSTSPSSAKRIAANDQAPGSWLIEKYADKPLAMAFLFQPSRMVERLREWSNYGFKTAVEVTEQPQINMFRGQADTLLRVLGCCKKIESVTIVDGKSIVTRKRSYYQDLED